MENEWRMGRVDDYVDKNCPHCNHTFSPEYVAQERLKIIKKWHIMLSSCYVGEARRNEEEGIFYPSSSKWGWKWRKRYKEFAKEYEAELRELGFVH